jgi:hypothetical protein
MDNIVTEKQGQVCSDLSGSRVTMLPTFLALNSADDRFQEQSLDVRANGPP